MVENIILDLSRLLYEIPAVLLAIGIHEYFHALAASRLGDTTAQEMGLLNINPFPRLELFGFLMFIWFNYGWTKDTPVDDRRLGPSRLKSAIVILAGIGGNILLALSFLLVLLLKKPAPESYFYNFIGHSIVVNFNMVLINLLPIMPLDGGKLLSLYVPGYRRFVFPGALALFLVSLTDFSRGVQGLSHSILSLFT